MNNQREGSLQIDRFVDILREYGLNGSQIEYLWVSKPCGLDEKTLRRVADLLSPIMIEATVANRVLMPRPTREELKRRMNSRHFKTKACHLKERATV